MMLKKGVSMNVFLTVYSTPTWRTLIKANHLKAIDYFPTSEQEACALLTPQTVSSLSKLLEQSQNIQPIWIATVQAEYSIAEALDKGQPIEEAALNWEQLTSDLLRLQSKHRKVIKLFNL